jgi:NhaP-type Na+/H+ or K+/H+ antiporter
LYYFVSLAISIILFEGGLTLKRSEIKTVGTVITKLITIGSAITFLGAGIIAHAVFKLSWEVSFLFSGLIIVTGPTVITPILRNIPLKKDLSTVLKWEGILIDPIGALIAVLVFEFISVEGDSGYTKTAFIEFAKIIFFGILFGFSFAKALAICVNKKLVPHYLLNVVSLSVVLLVFVAADFFAHESGLLAVVVMGMVLGNSQLENIKELLYFKESLSVLLISILFILLAANINMEDLLLIYTWKTVLLFSTIVFLIRPLGVFICTANSSLKLNEKLFISWVGPRGIVAAGIASLFGSKLIKKGIEGAEYITPLVFMVVLGTVLLNATTARFFAKIAGVFLQKSEGILIVGASNISRLLATYLKKNNRHVVLIDSNQTNIEEAKKLDLEAMHTDIYANDLMNNIELNDIGFLMALTGNSNINQYAIKKFKKQFGENGSFRLVTSEEISKDSKKPKEGLLFDTDNYNSILELTFRHPSIHEITLNDKKHYEQLIEITKKDNDIIPLFIKDKKGTLHIISSHNLKTETIKSGFEFVYMGKPIDFKK